LSKTKKQKNKKTKNKAKGIKLKKTKPENRVFVLFKTACVLSAVAFGGGYAVVQLMKKKFVNELGWLEEDELMNLIAIAQTAPGPVFVQAFLLVGLRSAEIKGAIAATFGTVLPPFAMISLVSLGYNIFRDSPAVAAVMKGLQAGVAAVISDVVINMGAKISVRDKDFISCLVMAGAFAASYFFRINIILIIIACGVIGIIRNMIRRRKEEKDMNAK
jgi:chromate transporter